MLDDTEIIALYTSREQSAIGETKKKYERKLTGLCYKILGSSEECEECVNDTYFELWDKIPPEIPVYLFGYMAKICRFIAFGRLDYLKAKKRSADIIALTEELETCIPDKSAEISVDEMGLTQILEQFLEGISKEKRLIFLRRYWFSDSIEEISKRFECSESKVKTSLYRTRQELEIHLGKEGITV
ncbi:MAG: sigma-70 family RNA polymerase sigma factor [Eubacteriales bacterium]